MEVTYGTTAESAQEFLAACSVDPQVFELQPDYRALLMIIDGVSPVAGTTGNPIAEELLSSAQAHVEELLASAAITELPHIAAWREAYRGFGVKPQRTRNSLEALSRRAPKGLPRVNTLTDIYNAISVLHQVPVGGEDLALYDGPAHLLRATGSEDFVTTAHGERIIEHPEVGEVIWRDQAGVTCRAWNWRQGPRTALSTDTNMALFIFDALAPMDNSALHAAGQALIDALNAALTQVLTGKTQVRVESRLVSGPGE